VGQVIKLTEEAGSGSGATSSTNSNKAKIVHFGLQSNANNTLFATWTWGRGNTESFKVIWAYDTGNGVWFTGTSSTITVEDDAAFMSRQSTYSIPNNALRVQFKVKPISKTYKKNNTDTKYWEAQWSDIKTWSVVPPLDTPNVPTVEIDKYKLTATLDNINIEKATDIEFQVVKDNSANPFVSRKVDIVSSHASCAFDVNAGAEYKVRCRAYNARNKSYSEWSNYSDNTVTIPDAVHEAPNLKVISETSVMVDWSKVTSATSYDIEYTTNRDYFDYSDKTTTKTGIETTRYEVTGLETGNEYFFRVRAVNKVGSSAWSDIRSIALGKDPAAPTTWSSTTTAITGETVNLYWVHNAEDGSSETYAELELYIGGEKETYTIHNTNNEDEKDKTSSYTIDTSIYLEGTQIQWRVRTAGITKNYGDWSIQRTIDIYAPATIELKMTDIDHNPIGVLEAFPFYIDGRPGPRTQAPIGYYLTITSNEMYETVDRLGNAKVINSGDEVYAKYFDENQPLEVALSAGDVDLENNVEYTVTCKVSMNSGLTAESSINFSVSWTDEQYAPNAEIGIDEASMTANIRPYCEDRKLIPYNVAYSSGAYTKTTPYVGSVWGEPYKNKTTTTGEQVYFGAKAADGTEIYFCYSEEIVPMSDVWLSVYRREFDGKFTELATGLDGAKRTTIVDPHPALDYARYRIVAASKTTGAISYYDLPGYPVGGKAVIIQWDEEWSSFDTSEEAALEQPPWTGSMLVLPYNIDVSDGHNPDIALVKYIGRSHPISYYGTQLGHTSSWSMAIEKDDEETLYTLRRLANWMGDVYVREPSGSGYWASVNVSFSQKHRDMTIPVTLDITRVEGGA
jgi:hypothetical protein